MRGFFSSSLPPLFEGGLEHDNWMRGLFLSSLPHPCDVIAFAKYSLRPCRGLVSVLHGPDLETNKVPTTRHTATAHLLSPYVVKPLPLPPPSCLDKPISLTSKNLSSDFRKTPSFLRPVRKCFAFASYQAVSNLLLNSS